MLYRIITSIKGAPGEYGVEETKLRPFEKLLQEVEGKLMDGHIFEVNDVCECVRLRRLKSCIHPYLTFFLSLLSRDVLVKSLTLEKSMLSKTNSLPTNLPSTFETFSFFSSLELANIMKWDREKI